MAKTRPGVERITKLELTAARGGLNTMINGHMKVCHQCKVAGNDVYLQCSEWWNLAKSLHKVNRALSGYTDEQSGNQLALPGMEDI